MWTVSRERARWLTLAATSLGFGVVQLDVSVVNVAIKPIGAALGGGVGSLQWVVNAYTLAFAALILVAGALGDRIGAKRVFVTGFVVFTAASAACGLAPSLGFLICARAVQGVGAAVLVPCSLALLRHTFPDSAERARAVGLWAAGASVALSAGPLIGGILTETLGWRAIFFINAPIGVAGILITIRWAVETPPAEGRPMPPLSLFRSATFTSATAIGLLVNIAFYGLIFVLSLFFQRGQHLSALRTGLAFAPMTVAVMAANLTASRLAATFAPGRVILGGALAMTAGAAALLGAGPASPYWALVVQLTAIGFGLGLVVPAMTTSLLGSVDPSRAGVASGTLNTARQTGSVIGVEVYGALIAGGRLVSGLHAALGITVGLSLVVAGLGAGIRSGAP